MEFTLRELYQQHQGKVSDKWSSYLVEYERLFSAYRNMQIRMLEIGVRNGGSLEIWAKYFPNAELIIGCDIDPICSGLAYEEKNIVVVVGDANADQTQAQIVGSQSQFDIVIDDGSHTAHDVIRSFSRYFLHIADGGIYIAEDLHCSYWAEFEGGLLDPLSSISFFKRLSDVINFEHWGVPIARSQLFNDFNVQYGVSISEELLAQVHSVEFINSICVVRKNSHSSNVLGPRFIAGQVEAVAAGHARLHMSVSPVPRQTINPLSVVHSITSLPYKGQESSLYSKYRKPTKLFTCTAHTDPNKLEYLKQVLHAQQFLFDEVHVCIATNKINALDLELIASVAPPNTDRFRVEIVNRDYDKLPSPWLLTWAHKPLMLEKYNDASYTHFMYIEDDMEITRANVEYWKRAREDLRSYGLYPSFIRVEWNEAGGEWAMVDLLKGDKFAITALPRVNMGNGVNYINLPRSYQGMFLYDRDLMDEHIKSSSFDLFQTVPHWQSAILHTDWPLGLTEAANSALSSVNVPSGCYSRNFLPYFAKYKMIDPSSFVHHLPNKYTQMPGSQHGKVLVRDVLC